MFVAIVPAYNEEDKVGSVIRNLFEHTDRVVVVDDCSSDNTAQIAKDFGADILRHKINRGQGASLQTGQEYALSIGADYAIHFDADGQFDADDILPALDKMKSENADILFGSRFLDHRSNVPWLKKHLILPIGKYVNILFGSIKLSDAHNGFRILNRKALDKIVITQDRMAHASEIPALVKKHDLKYVEYPVKVTYDEYGQRASGGFKIIYDLFLGKFIN